MTLSIELLPAPLGPMMARTSCSRMLNEMSVRALTPPNFLLIVLSPLGRFFGDREGLHIDDLEVGGYLAATPILELDLGFDVLVALARIEGIDQHLVFFRDEIAAHLASMGQLVIIGVQFLVQDEEAMDLRVGNHAVVSQGCIHFLDSGLDNFHHLSLACEI